MNSLINLMIKTCLDTIYMTGMIIFVGFILGFLRNHSIENFQKSFGWKAVAITAIIGVPIHELSHAILCVVFSTRYLNWYFYKKKMKMEY